MMFDSRPAARIARRFFIAAFGAVAIFFSGAAAATSYSYDNRTVDYLGVVSWGQYGGYVAFVEGLPPGGGGVPNTCVNGVASFDQTQNNSKYWYMTLLTAKASALHVQVDITQDIYNNCFIAGARIKT